MNGDEMWVILKEGHYGQFLPRGKYSLPLRNPGNPKARLAILKTRHKDGHRFPIYYQEYNINGSLVTMDDSVQMSNMLWEVHRAELPPYELLRELREINRTLVDKKIRLAATTEPNYESYVHLGFAKDYEITITPRNFQVLRHLKKEKRVIIVICGTEEGTSVGRDHPEGTICRRNGTYIRIGMLEVQVEKKKAVIKDYREALIYDETIFYPVINQLKAIAYRIYYQKYHRILREQINLINQFQSLDNGQANKLRDPLIINCHFLTRNGNWYIVQDRYH